MNEPTPTLLEAQLQDLKDAGANVHKGVRTMKDNVSPEKANAVNKRALELWLPRWIQNAAANYNHIKQSASLEWLRSCAAGLPVVVVGIGPSLDQEIETLKKVAGRNAIIVATDAALRPLLANRIKPHLVINFDCKADQYTLFDGLDDFTKDIVLLANSCTHPMTLACWAGPVLFYNMQHPGVDFMDIVLPTMFPRFGPLSNHGTVGTSALLVAYQMGASTIITVGMDLCYQKVGDDFRYRCRDYKWKTSGPVYGGKPDYPHGEWEPSENKVLYENSERLAQAYDVKLKDREFKVDEALEFYRKGTVELIGRMGDVRIVDCSSGGILGAAGVEQLGLQAVIDECCGQEIGAGQSVILHMARLLPRLNNDATGA